MTAPGPRTRPATRWRLAALLACTGTVAWVGVPLQLPLLWRARVAARPER